MKTKRKLQQKLHQIGEEIRLARLKKRWSQGQLAKMVGISQATISAWERGKKEPTYLTFCEIRRKLNLVSDRS